MTSFQKLKGLKAASESVAEPAPGMVANLGGGFSFPVDKWTVLDRFIIMGTDGNSYYQDGTKQALKALPEIEAAIREDGLKVVDKILEISKSGRAPKNEPALFALAMCAKHGDLPTRQKAYEVLPEIARIGTHLFHFASFMKEMGKSGSGYNRALKRWYLGKTQDQLALQLVKYQQRDGFSHRDVLRLCKPSTDVAATNAAFKWATKGVAEKDAHALIHAYEKAKTIKDETEMALFVTEAKLTREMIPTEFHKSPDVQEALLPNLGLTAMIRNLGNMSAAKILNEFSPNEKLVLDRLTDAAALRKARIHPINVLVAMNTYKHGYGLKGGNKWSVNDRIVSALEAAFYASFTTMPKHDKRVLISLDVSGSMDSYNSLAIGTTHCELAACMAMSFVRTTPNAVVKGFASTLVDLGINDRDTLESAAKKAQKHNFGSTNASAPIEWATSSKIPFDGFACFTDGEINTGIKPHLALRKFEKALGVKAASAMVAFEAQNFTMHEPGTGIDIAGFDSAIPQIITDYMCGNL